VAPIPFGNHKLVAGVEVVESTGKLRASGHAFAGCRVRIDRGATEALERLRLPRQVLLLRADAGVPDQPFCGFRSETHL